MGAERAPKPSGARAKARATKATAKAEGQFDRLIHSRVRLAICSALAVHDTLSFTELKEILETSDGNLSVHARKLEEAGYLKVTKGFEGRIPHTEFALTAKGRQALAGYLDHMEALIHKVREG